MKKKSRVYPRKSLRRKKAQNPAFFFLGFLIILAISLVVLIKTGVRIPFFPNTGLENLALGRVTRSTSWLSLSKTAAQAVDGDPNTFWESNRALPASITVTLDRPYLLNQVVVKLPVSWAPRAQTIEVLGSLDNINFVQITPPASYLVAAKTTINFNPSLYRFVRLVVSSNAQTSSAQIGEFEVYGIKPHWDIQSIDVMKFTKDRVCSPPSTAVINKMNDLIASAGANFVAIATPYDDPPCGSSRDLTKAWINSARARKLGIWHRHMGLSFEGMGGHPKVKDLPSYRKQIVDYILNNPDQFRDGDIFTPTPEPDSAGIDGVTYCGELSICQFSNITEYNLWIQITQAAVKAAFATIGKDVKVGYYGHSSFIVWGENNPDWEGQSFLTQATVDSMDGVIAMDTYPEVYGGKMNNSINGAHKRWPNAKIVVGEWGPIFIATSSARVQAITNSMMAAERSFVIGFNYWSLGPSGNEGLLDQNFNPTDEFEKVKDFYIGFH